MLALNCVRYHTLMIINWWSFFQQQSRAGRKLRSSASSVTMSSVATTPDTPMKQVESDGSDLLFAEPNLLLFSTNSNSNMSKASSKASSNVSSSNASNNSSDDKASATVSRQGSGVLVVFLLASNNYSILPIILGFSVLPPITKSDVIWGCLVAGRLIINYSQKRSLWQVWEKTTSDIIGGGWKLRYHLVYFQFQVLMMKWKINPFCVFTLQNYPQLIWSQFSQNVHFLHYFPQLYHKETFSDRCVRTSPCSHLQ